MADDTTATPAAPPSGAPAAPPAEGAAATPPPPAPAPDKKPEPISPKLAAIAKEEARIRAEKEALKAEREALAKEKAEAERRAKLKSEDIDKWLEEEGFQEGYVGLTNLKLAGKKAVEPKVEEPPHPRVVELEKQLAEMNKREQERAEAENARQAAAYRDHTFDVIAKAGEKYELVNAMGDEGKARVWAIIQETARTEGKVLTPDEAAEKAEALFEEAVAGESVKRLLTTKKASSRLGLASAQSADPKPAVPEAKSESGPTRAAPTLTNSLASVAPPPATRLEDLPFHERVKLAKRQG